MNADRYARVRDLFFAADELSGAARQKFLETEIGDDKELMADVLSLLDEHDAELARLEGAKAMPVPAPRELGEPTVAPGDGTAKQSRAAKPTQIASASEITQPPRTDKLDTERADKKVSASEITQRGAERTHASPKDFESRGSKDRTSPSELLLANKSRRARRINSGWLWLAAVLPTLIVGYLTYHSVSNSVQLALRNELTGVSNSIDLATGRFLDDKAQLVQSWARQSLIRDSILGLVELSDRKSKMDVLQSAPLAAQIRSELRILSGRPDVKFVVWNQSFTTIASWREDNSDLGHPVIPSGTSDVARVLRGETVIYGPDRGDGPASLTEDEVGTVDEVIEPMMACIVPIRDGNSEVVAALLVNSIGLFKEFNELFHESSVSSGLDIYAINRDAEMISVSPHAASLFHRSKFDMDPETIVAGLRVSDPGGLITESTRDAVVRRSLPLTESASAATLGESLVRLEPYSNYAGESVVGGWRWIPRWRFAVIVEKDVRDAFAAARIVWYSFLLLGSLLTVTALVSAGRLARSSARDQAAVHPLSRYEIISELGSGGMGVVYKVKHLQLGRNAALKLLRSDRQNREDQLRFDREARLAASLTNPHSVTIYDYGRSEEGEAYCVMEYLSGLTLQEVVARSGFQSIGRVLFVLRQVCEALGEAHSMDLVHRDIKPQNIMLSLDPSIGDWAVVFDYGLAKPLSPEKGTYQTREVIWAGTPMYMAPERFRSPSVMDPSSDIYSVGCVAYYLLAGRPPFAECDPESLFALIISEQPIGLGIHRGEDVPESVRNCVLKCMAKNAADRYASIDELATAIDALRIKYPWTSSDAVEWWKQHGEA